MFTPMKRPAQFTARQKTIMESLRAGHRVLLQRSVVTGQFTGYVSVFDVPHGRYELVHWRSIEAMIDRDLVRLDGSSMETSLEIMLRATKQEAHRSVGSRRIAPVKEPPNLD